MQIVHRRFGNQLTNIFKISLTLFIKGYSETQKDAKHEKYFNISFFQHSYSSGLLD